MTTSEPGGSAGDLADAVAVIGLAGRFPGARSVEEYWENLCAGVETIARFTADQSWRPPAYRSVSTPTTGTSRRVVSSEA